MPPPIPRSCLPAAAMLFSYRLFLLLVCLLHSPAISSQVLLHPTSSIQFQSSSSSSSDTTSSYSSSSSSSSLSADAPPHVYPPSLVPLAVPTFYPCVGLPNSYRNASITSACDPYYDDDDDDDDDEEEEEEEGVVLDGGDGHTSPSRRRRRRPRRLCGSFTVPSFLSESEAASLLSVVSSSLSSSSSESADKSKESSSSFSYSSDSDSSSSSSSSSASSSPPSSDPTLVSVPQNSGTVRFVFGTVASSLTMQNDATNVEKVKYSCRDGANGASEAREYSWLTERVLSYASEKFVRTFLNTGGAEDDGTAPDDMISVNMAFVKREGSAEAPSWPPHVDTACLPNMHVTVVIYLNDDYEGGEFFFFRNDTKTTKDMDKDKKDDDDDARDAGLASPPTPPPVDLFVPSNFVPIGKFVPAAGLANFFTSGQENVHGVNPVTSGTRYAIVFYITCGMHMVDFN